MLVEKSRYRIAFDVGELLKTNIEALEAALSPSERVLLQDLLIKCRAQCEVVSHRAIVESAKMMALSLQENQQGRYKFESKQVAGVIRRVHFLARITTLADILAPYLESLGNLTTIQIVVIPVSPSFSYPATSNR